MKVCGQACVSMFARFSFPIIDTNRNVSDTST